MNQLGAVILCYSRPRLDRLKMASSVSRMNMVEAISLSSAAIAFIFPIPSVSAVRLPGSGWCV